MRVTAGLFRRTQYEATHPIKLRPELPLALRDRVASKGNITKERECFNELIMLLQCFKDHDFNETRCASTIQSFNKCVSDHSAKRLKEAQNQSKRIPATKDTRKLTPQQVNQYLKKFPQL